MSGHLQNKARDTDDVSKDVAMLILRILVGN